MSLPEAIQHVEEFLRDNLETESCNTQHEELLGFLKELQARRSTPLYSPVKPEDIGYGRYFIRKDSVGVNLLRFVTVDLSGRLVVYKRSNEVGTVDDYVLRGHTFFRIPELPELEVAE